MTDLNALAERVEAEPCEYCGGYGETYGHADDCDNDSCALAGGYDDCLGKVEPCGVCARMEAGG